MLASATDDELQAYLSQLPVPDYRGLVAKQKGAAEGRDSVGNSGGNGLSTVAVPLAALAIAAALFSGSSFGGALLGGVDGAPVRSNVPEGFKTPLERYREQGFIK